MDKNVNTKTVELTNEQAIDKIYEIQNQYEIFTKGGAPLKREPLNIERVGEYGLINPGVKDMSNIIAKLCRKGYKDAKDPNDKENILNQYNQREDELFNKLSDYSRFTVIIPNYQSLPALLSYFLGSFGGEVIIHDEKHDNKKDYEAIHLHFNYKGVNVELQFHTKEYAELKQATDIFYHAYANVPTPNNSVIKEEYDAQQAAIAKYCQVVYQRSDFKASLPAIEAVVAAYKEKQKNPTNLKEKMKFSYFCAVWRKALMVQKELAETLPNILRQFTQLEKDSIALEK